MNEDKGLNNSWIFLFVRRKARKILSNWSFVGSFSSEFAVLLKASCPYIFSDVLDTFLARYLGLDLHFYDPSSFRHNFIKVFHQAITRENESLITW